SLSSKSCPFSTPQTVLSLLQPDASGVVSVTIHRHRTRTFDEHRQTDGNGKKMVLEPFTLLRSGPIVGFGVGNDKRRFHGVGAKFSKPTVFGDANPFTEAGLSRGP